MSKIDVIYSFRSLIRTANRLFKDDQQALWKARHKIRSEFDKNKTVTDQKQIQDLLRDARQARAFISQHVVQVKENKDDQRKAPYYVRVTKDTARLDGELETVSEFKKRLENDEKKDD